MQRVVIWRAARIQTTFRLEGQRELARGKTREGIDRVEGEKEQGTDEWSGDGDNF